MRLLAGQARARSRQVRGEAGRLAPRAAGQHKWNGGKYAVGTSRPEANTAVRAVCPTDGCGQEAAGRFPRQRGWVRVHVTGSTEPARDYCSGSCATYGIALAAA